MPLRIDEIKINGSSISVPDENGFKRTKNKIWSSNTGRSASGKMLGDIVAVKYTLDFAWSKLTAQEVKNLETAVGTAAFFPVVFPEEGTGKTLTKNFYAADMTYGTKKYENGTEIYSDVSLQIIEQ